MSTADAQEGTAGRGTAAAGRHGRDVPPHGGGVTTRGPNGLALFGGAMMLVTGFLSILQGIAALAKDDVIARVGDYVFDFGLTGWGVLHIVLGALVALTGFGVVQGAQWARFAGIVLASLALVANFLWLPYFPLWALVLIAMDALVLWGLASWDGPGGGAAV